MRKPCPICSGRGTIDDPTVHGPMGYCGPNGERWPQTQCQNCFGAGWVGKSNVAENPTDKPLVAGEDGG